MISQDDHGHAGRRGQLGQRVHVRVLRQAHQGQEPDHPLVRVGDGPDPQPVAVPLPAQLLEEGHSVRVELVGGGRGKVGVEDLGGLVQFRLVQGSVAE